MPQGPHVRNPQTLQLLDMIGLKYNLDHSELGEDNAGQYHYQAGQQNHHQAAFGTAGTSRQQDLLSRGGGQLPPPPPRQITDAQVAAALSNPEEIDLDDGNEEDDPMFRPL